MQSCLPIQIAYVSNSRELPTKYIHKMSPILFFEEIFRLSGPCQVTGPTCCQTCKVFIWCFSVLVISTTTNSWNMINLHRIWFTKIHTGILTIITRDTICTEIQVLIISLKDLLNLNSSGFERSTLLEQRLKVKRTD